jgi:hypothetical protein
MKAITATLEQQAAAVARAAANQRGHVDNLQSLVARGRRSKEELELQAAWTPALEDAAVTMRRLADEARKRRAGASPARADGPA